MNKLPYFFSLILLLNLAFSTPSAQAQERRGWSPQAKGAAIGGAAGILGGALINKRNRVVGGAIGGVAGAGVGYAIGKHTDNKRKERARIAAANRAVAAREAARDAEYRNALRRSAEHNNSREALVASRTQTTAVPYNGLAASQAGAVTAQGVAMPVVSNAAYLPNTAYGNPSNPYSTSEYRRKSW